jgi:hypothetical protein
VLQRLAAVLAHLLQRSQAQRHTQHKLKANEFMAVS